MAVNFTFLCLVFRRNKIQALANFFFFCLVPAKIIPCCKVCVILILIHLIGKNVAGLDKFYLLFPDKKMKSNIAFCDDVTYMINVLVLMLLMQVTFKFSWITTIPIYGIGIDDIRVQLERPRPPTAPPPLPPRPASTPTSTTTHTLSTSSPTSTTIRTLLTSTSTLPFPQAHPYPSKQMLRIFDRHHIVPSGAQLREGGGGVLGCGTCHP